MLFDADYALLSMYKLGEKDARMLGTWTEKGVGRWERWIGVEMERG
jgi:hypothetical protein